MAAEEHTRPMRRHRALRLLAALAGVTALSLWACSDPVAPANTVLGLRVWAEVVPETVHIGDTSGSIVIRVIEMNPGTHPLSFPLPTALLPNINPSRSAGFAEQYRISCDSSAFYCGPGNDAIRLHPDTFPPLQSKAVYWSLPLIDWALSGAKLKPGTYQVRSWYREQEGDAATLVLVP
jgi:hypothetical protein